MRLIDADELIDTIYGKDYFTQTIKDVLVDIIETQPTAYNPDKVVEQIKKSATDDDGLIVKDGNEPMIWKNKAIDIVKRGGVE